MFHSFPNDKFILEYGYPYFRCLESDFLILIQISSGMPSLPLIRWYFGFIFVWKVCLAFFRLPKVIPDSWSLYYSRKETLMQTCTRLQVFVLPYARHYNPRFLYFLPTFWSPKSFFKGLFFLKFWVFLRAVSNHEQVIR